MMHEYNTVAYKDKMSHIYQKVINELLAVLPEYCTAYEMYLRQRTVIKTRMEYLRDIHTFFRFILAKNPTISDVKNITPELLSKLNGFDFDEYSSWLVNYKFNEDDATEIRKKNSGATRKRKFAALKSLYHFLYLRSYISSNPSEFAISPKVRKKRRSDIRILDDNECAAFLAAIDEEFERTNGKLQEMKEQGRKISRRDGIAPCIAMRDKAIVYLFLGTGLRVSELCAIDCENISPLGYINVIRKEDADEDKTTDRVYIGEDVKKVLNAYIDRARMDIGPSMDNYDALFISSMHERITPRGVELMIKKYADRALGKDSGITPHKLRATFGTRYYAMTGDISATSTVMNHSSIEVTASYYLKEDKEAKERAADIKIN